ncbi:MAG: hypothetical protein RJA36_1868 [Pseudomonadota bacterium]
MKLSDAGLSLIKRHEGLRLKAYPDPGTGGEPWTIGYGHTQGVQPGQEITEAQAEDYLREDVYWAEDAVRDHVKVALEQHEFDALVSLAFNIGAGAFARSTLLRKLNDGDKAGAAAEFARWNQAGGKVLPGLVKRRADEAALFAGTDQNQIKKPLEWPFERPEPEKRTMPLPAIVAAVLPSIIEAIPRLGKLFGSGSEVAERNVKAAELAVEIVKDAAGAVNAQDAAEKVKADPVIAATAARAIEARWLELDEAGGGGIAGARKADAEVVAMDGPWWQFLRSPSFWALLLLVPLVYLLVGSLIGLWGTASWSDDVRAGLAGSIISAVIGGAVGYYWGQTTSRNRTPQ